MVRRSAFTLIEMIFAIVIMAIVVVSLPMMMQVDNDSRQKNFAQEAVLAASAKLSQVLTYQWDERSLSWLDLAENFQTNARIVDGTNFSTNAFNRVTGATESNISRANRMSLNRRFFDINETGAWEVNATSLADNNSTLVNGFEAVIGMEEQNITLGSNSGFGAGFTTSALGYKRNYRMSVEILRINDALSIGGVNPVDYTQSNLTGNNGFVFSQVEPAGIGANQNTNLRCAKITITDEDNTSITTLYGYSANIGEYSVASRMH